MIKKFIRKLVSVLIFSLLIGVFAFSAWKIYGIYSEYNTAENSYSELDQFISIPSPAPGQTKDPAPGHSLEAATEPGDPRESIVWPEIDFEALEDINSDVVGWIYIDGTKISYPVVQGADNDYYLKHMFTGKYNSSGCIFLDYSGASDFSDNNNILHGHHMRNGSMFAGLVKYKEQAYYDAHPFGLLITPDQRYIIDFFAGYVVNTSSAAWDDPADDDFQAWLDKAVSKSWFASDIIPTTDDHVLTLSTCSYEFNDARYVLHGVLTPVEP